MVYMTEQFLRRKKKTKSHHAIHQHLSLPTIPPYQVIKCTLQLNIFTSIFLLKGIISLIGATDTMIKRRYILINYLPLQPTVGAMIVFFTVQGLCLTCDPSGKR